MFKKGGILSNIAIGYFIFGLIFATGFAIYYKWSFLSFLSPGFYAVIFSWPTQIPGFLADFQQFGFSGKTF